MISIFVQDSQDAVCAPDQVSVREWLARLLPALVLLMVLPVKALAGDIDPDKREVLERFLEVSELDLTLDSLNEATIDRLVIDVRRNVPDIDSGTEQSIRVRSRAILEEYGFALRVREEVLRVYDAHYTIEALERQIDYLQSPDFEFVMEMADKSQRDEDLTQDEKEKLIGILNKEGFESAMKHHEFMVEQLDPIVIRHFEEVRPLLNGAIKSVL